jgi:hypothetical protein
MNMNKLCVAALTTGLFVTGIISASAATKSTFLLGTTLQTSSASGYIISSSQAIAQQFVLDSPAKTTSIAFVVGGSYIYDYAGTAGFGGDVSFLAQLTSGLGEGSIVLAQQQFTFPALASAYYAKTIFVYGP